MIKINLLPPEKRKKLKKVKSARKKGPALPKLKLDLKFDPGVVVPAGLALLVLLGIAASYFWLNHREKSLITLRNSHRVELNLLKVVIAKVNRLKQQTNQVKNRMEVILKIDQNRYLWPRILDEISGALPQHTWLESVSETSPFPQLIIRLEGTTITNLSLSRFLKNLELATLLTDVKLISSVERQHGGYDTHYFIIDCACALNEAPDTSAGATAVR